MSKRTEIIRYIRDLLEQAQTFDGPVYTSQSKAYSLEELPCALLVISKEKQEILSESAPRVIKKTSECSLQLIAEFEEGAEEEMHDVLSDIEHLILGDDTLGDRISRLMPDSLEFSTHMEGERPIISGKFKFEATYYERMIRDQELPTMNVNAKIVEAPCPLK